MPPTWLVIVAPIVWTALAVGVGVLIGKGIRHADERDARLKAAQKTPTAVTFAVNRSTPRRTLPRRWW